MAATERPNRSLDQRSAPQSTSLRLDAALLDDAPPLLLLAFQVRGGLLGRARDDRQTPLLVELHLFGGGERLADVRIQRVDNRTRRALRRRNHEPGVELVAR